MFDLKKVHGIDILSQLENAMANELSQSISKEILERLFALGWTSNQQVFLTEGMTLNTQILQSQSTAVASSIPGRTTFVGMDGVLQTVQIPAFVSYGSFENQATIHQRILSKIQAASNVITRRNRNRGGATFVVTNIQVASALQSNANYTFAPIDNKLSQQSGSLYAMGTLAGGLTLYVDPNMSYSDTRVLVGRRGAENEPGLKFLPYAMAESVAITAEQTMAPKMLLSSRYALVDFGQYAQLMYYTFMVDNQIPLIG
jgi:hypothetical protein